MARPQARRESGSLLKAIDGSNLKWNDFRQNVLHPFGISIANGGDLHAIPSAISSRLQERLQDTERFDTQRRKWREQVAIGQSLESTTVFPPNILPQTKPSTKLQRFLSPKMSREVLPRRAKSINSLFELPSARPMYATAFVSEAFSENEHAALPNSLSPVGTIVDFATGQVVSGRILHCPFLVFERCQGTETDDVQKALNMCAVSGAQCVRGLQDIAQRALKTPRDDEIFAFSSLVNDKMATINIHTVDDQGKYVMSALYKFDLLVDEHFNTFQTWVETIEDWAMSTLLPRLKDFLAMLSHVGDTPPASPMPSLTLSIDTEVGMVPGLIPALRRMYPTIAWRGDEMSESPINSSIAHCGTPAAGRRSQRLALGSPPLTSTFSNLMLRRGRGSSTVAPIDIKNQLHAYAPARPSPFSPRYTATTPGLMTGPMTDYGQDSPCRPPTLSPFTPPPDQPWSARAPMLVLQKRVDVAMDEVQDLRNLVEILQTELAAKNQILNERLVAMESSNKTTAQSPGEKSISKVLGALDISLHLDSIYSWINSALKQDGWEVIMEQVLFFIAVVALVVMGLSVLQHILPIVVHIPFLMTSTISRLLVRIRSLFGWEYMNRVPEFFSNLVVKDYFQVEQGLEQ